MLCGMGTARERRRPVSCLYCGGVLEVVVSECSFTFTFLCLPLPLTSLSVLLVVVVLVEPVGSEFVSDFTDSECVLVFFPSRSVTVLDCEVDCVVSCAHSVAKLKRDKNASFFTKFSL
jgi:hypothetical protein